MSSGVVTAPFPPFKEGAQGIKPLDAEGGVVGKRSRRPLIDIREADLILLEITNHYYASPYRARASRPSCAAEERDLLVEAEPPLLKNGAEWALDTAVYNSLSQTKLAAGLQLCRRAPLHFVANSNHWIHSKCAAGRDNTRKDGN